MRVNTQVKIAKACNNNVNIGNCTAGWFSCSKQGAEKSITGGGEDGGRNTAERERENRN